MSMYIDVKYLMMIANRLERFVKKSPTLFNCRCPICGDSATNKTKARGYFYKQRNDLLFKCHNCDASMQFGTFLKTFDPQLYKNFVLERYGKTEKKPVTKSKKASPKAPTFTTTDKFEQLAIALDHLPPEHEAVRYVTKRGIPRTKYPLLYFVKDIADLLPLFPQYRGKIMTGNPRIAMPFYDAKGILTGVSLRAIRGEALRYLILKKDEDEETPLIFGLRTLDTEKSIYVVEGAIDSLFLPNCIACNGTSFGKIDTLALPKDRITVVIDNQPRNKEVCKMYEKYIGLGYKICVWPANMEAKDLNDLAQAGYAPESLVKKNTYSGLAAQVAFTQWSKCNGNNRNTSYRRTRSVRRTSREVSGT